MAITASFLPNNGTLSVFGDALPNGITVSRNAAGTLLLNGGAVAIQGGTPTVANTALIQAFGQSGDDVIALDEANGALPQANLFGGTGNDILIGGSAADQLFGQDGNDTLLGKGGADKLFGGAGDDTLTGGDGDDQVFGEAGNDRLIWNPGDDSDVFEGGDGIDTAEVNGGNGAEIFTITANGSRVRFDRTNPAPFSLDIGTAENLVLNANSGDDVITAGIGLSSLISLTIDGGAGNDTITGGDGADVLLGGDGVDTLFGGDGSDLLSGGAGADTMTGGAGNDRYLIEDAGDNVIEAAGGGTDTVVTGNSFALGARQSIEVFQTNNVFGIDAINLTGNEFAQQIVGNNGNNVIDGKGGVDTMVGLGGNDTYLVDNARDQVFETADEGTDRVLTSVSYRLGAGQSIEALTTSKTVGTDALNLTGNDFAQTIVGNAGNNVIDGRGGADSMAGVGGNDTYLVDNAGDQVLEAAGGGSDRVRTSVSYALGASQSIEALTTTNSAGTGAINLIGNDLVQAIIGNAGSNVIDGRGGDDTLTGGLGKDVFRFGTALNAATNVDRITDFSVAADIIELSHAIFAAVSPGTLSADAFFVGAAAHDASDRVLYNSGTGALSYDVDGIGAGAAVQFATLSPGLTTLTASQFHVIA